MGRLLGRSFNYKTVAASQTTQPIIGQGGYIYSIAVAPGSSAVGAWSLLDGSTTIYAAPALAGGDSKPYYVIINSYSQAAGGFNITTGSSVTLLVSGNPPPRDDN